LDIFLPLPLYSCFNLHFSTQAMKTIHTCLLLSLLLIGRFSFAQTVPVIKYPALERLLTQPTDTVLVVNFWATWCSPCVEQLPYFEQLKVNHAADKVKVILVNLDGIGQLTKKVQPFIAKTGLKSPGIVLLDEPNHTSWIGKVSADWSGAIPFTLIIDPSRKQRKTLEKGLTLAELETALRPFIQ
jgi:thiol-disulfide isomerase/thioredoxin